MNIIEINIYSSFERQHDRCLRLLKALWTQRQARVVEVSETGALWLRQHSLFDILYKKQTVSTGCVHKHSMHKSWEDSATQFPSAIADEGWGISTFSMEKS